MCIWNIVREISAILPQCVDFVVNIVPADGVMPLSAETSAVVTMNGSHA